MSKSDERFKVRMDTCLHNLMLIIYILSSGLPWGVGKRDRNVTRTEAKRETKVDIKYRNHYRLEDHL